MVLLINGHKQTVEVDPTTPLLWVLRDRLGLTGTKFGCGAALCGACTVHVEGEAIRSCVTPVREAAGKRITTIEGLAPERSHPLQQAWIAEEVPQCGYCQPGMIMTAAALLERQAKPTDADIDEALAGHICRCGTYQRIRRAIHRASRLRPATAGSGGQARQRQGSPPGQTDSGGQARQHQGAAVGQTGSGGGAQ
jgi:aerobic-type carbon monoxide dehydrogenase small subunit (CoxS/CutS family)